MEKELFVVTTVDGEVLVPRDFYSEDRINHMIFMLKEYGYYLVKATSEGWLMDKTRGWR